jgi:O-antigen ligase
MKNAISYINIYQFLLGVCSFLLCFSPKFVPIGLILIFLVGIVGLVKKQAAIVFPNKLMLAFILLYLAYLIGFLFTNNAPVGLKYLEYKLSFILIPVIFFIRPKQAIGLFSVTVGLIAAILFITATSLVEGIQCYSEIDYFLECFTSSYLTTEHPTYFAVYLTLSMALSWFGWKNNFRFFKLPFVLLYNLIALTMLVLGLSLSGVSFALLVIGIIVLILINKRWGKWAALSTILAAPILLIFLFFSVPSLKSDISGSLNSFSKFAENPDQFLEFNGTHSGDDVRLIMWTVTAKEIVKHPMGVGTGDVDFHLSERLQSYHQTEMARKDERGQILYNPHNQFLQTGLEIGIIGMIILMFIVCYGIVKGIKTKNWLLLLLAANLAYNCLFESMLQRQSGIVFFTFWLALLSIYSVKSETVETIEDA